MSKDTCLKKLAQRTKESAGAKSKPVERLMTEIDFAQAFAVLFPDKQAEWNALIEKALTTVKAAMDAAGMSEADVAAAVTAEDAENLVVASLAKFQFNVRRVISRINNPRHAWLFTPEFGVDVALN